MSTRTAFGIFLFMLSFAVYNNFVPIFASNYMGSVP